MRVFEKVPEPFLGDRTHPVSELLLHVVALATFDNRMSNQPTQIFANPSHPFLSCFNNRRKFADFTDVWAWLIFAFCIWRRKHIFSQNWLRPFLRLYGDVWRKRLSGAATLLLPTCYSFFKFNFSSWFWSNKIENSQQGEILRWRLR